MAQSQDGDAVAMKDHPAKSQSGSTNAHELRLDPCKENLKGYPTVVELFPISEQDIGDMVRSIEGDGQFDPITILRKDGARFILDGLTRFMACRQLKKRCRYVVITEKELAGKSPAEWAIARNVASKSGRQLNDSQRAIVAARSIKAVFEPLCKANSRSGKAVPKDERGTANERAARAVGVTPNRVRQAVKILGDEEIVGLVWDGTLAISKAAQLMSLSEEERILEIQLAKAEKVMADQSTDSPAEKPKQPTKKSTTLKDGLRTEIPAQLISVFQTKKVIDRHIRALMKMEAWLETAKEAHAGRLLEALSTQSVTSLRLTLEEARPFAVCPDRDKHPQGGRCPTCKNEGWLSEKEYNHFRESNKEKLR